jgi:hypothetical protein
LIFLLDITWVLFALMLIHPLLQKLGLLREADHKA